jgi:hypothetical protein
MLVGWCPKQDSHLRSLVEVGPVCRGPQPSAGCQGLDWEPVASLAVSGRTDPLQSILIRRGLAGEFWMTRDTVVTPSGCCGCSAESAPPHDMARPFQIEKCSG